MTVVPAAAALAACAVAAARSCSSSARPTWCGPTSPSATCTYELVVAGEVELLARRGEVGAEQAEAAQFLVEQVLAGLLVARAIELVEPGAHLVARTAAGEEAVGRHQPVATRLAGLGGQDLDAVAAAQLVVERHDAAVDLGAAAAMPDLGVHVVGEVERRRARRAGRSPRPSA